MATSTYEYEHANKGLVIIAVNVVDLFISTVPFSLRMYIRLTARPRTYGIDDSLLVVSWVCSV